ncbi:hypothetical protein ACH3VR_09445 [Microbacterium sp. B2969]|uniref:Lipoprotein n=1 Tax=Microbacterium alkaliflavum TaxID=3248839 RepID=A0ABW7Q8U4_9MICO
MNRRIAALTLAAVALLGLTACTATPDSSASSSPTSSDAPGDEGQSVADACSLIQDTITQATREFSDAATEDPAAVVAAMRSAADKISAAASQITNDDVAAILPDLQAMFAKTAEVMQGIVQGDVSKLDELTALGDSFKETSQRFEDLCSQQPG